MLKECEKRKLLEIETEQIEKELKKFIKELDRRGKMIKLQSELKYRVGVLIERDELGNLMITLTDHEQFEKYAKEERFPAPLDKNNIIHINYKDETKLGRLRTLLTILESNSRQIGKIALNIRQTDDYDKLITQNSIIKQEIEKILQKLEKKFDKLL